MAGASNPHRAELEAAVERSGAAIRLLSAVTDMPGLMAWADVAVAAGGTTAWERANPWFASEVLPALRAAVIAALG